MQKICGFPESVGNLPIVCSAAAGAEQERPEGAALLCIAAPETATDRMMYMPAGVHTINPSQKGKPVQVEVQIDRQSALTMEQQRVAMVAAGRRPFFDFNHADGEASFWPTGFEWSETPAPGVYARGEWSGPGREAIEGKAWRQFSPVFFVNDIKAKPARVICVDGAPPNMGGLVNKPAFKAIMPLWSKDAESAEQESADGARRAAIRSLHAAAKRLLRTLRS